MRAKAFEIGQTYGSLKILDSHYKGTSLYYTVECQDCGSTYDAQVTSVRNGCKFCRTERNRAARKQEYSKMIGQQYGDLVVTGVEDKPYGPSTAFRVDYKCTKCGYEGKILPYKLRDGVTTQCPRCGKRGRPKGENDISFNKKTGKYQVTISIRLDAGRYETLEEAMQARDEAREKIKDFWEKESQ